MRRLQIAIFTPAVVIYLNFQPLEMVSRYCDPQPQVIDNYLYLLNLRAFTNLDVCKVISFSIPVV